MTENSCFRDKNKENKIKRVLLNHDLFRDLMEYYNIPIRDIVENMEILFCNLSGKFAEGNGQQIRINRALYKDELFEKNFHFIVHEFFHWVRSRAKKRFYFQDPEEIQSFVLSIAWEIMNGRSINDIKKTFFPLINRHFTTKLAANKFFIKMINISRKIADIY